MEIEKIYISEKEASTRYSLSRQWFQRSRWSGSGPAYIKVNGTGKVLYPIVSTDLWFSSHKLQANTARYNEKLEVEELV